MCTVTAAITALVHHRGSEADPVTRVLRALGCEVIESETDAEVRAVLRHDPPQLLVLLPGDAEEARASFAALPYLGPRGTGVLLLATPELAAECATFLPERVDQVIEPDATFAQLTRWVEYARRLALSTGTRMRSSIIRVQSG